jgi:GNAT superfamily N-acetyltransferase
MNKPALPARGPVGPREYVIREAHPEEFKELGLLMVSAYSNLDGFPKPHEQPHYYEMLADVGQFAQKPDTKLLVAVARNQVLGGLVYFSDMAQYGSGGTAIHERNASGFRLLAVDPEARGMGVGRALVERCIELAQERKQGQVILHTTKAMTVAWEMYEDRGFERSPDLDFRQGALDVFGFRLKLGSSGIVSPCDQKAKHPASGSV